MVSAIAVVLALSPLSQDYKTMCPLMKNRPTTGRMAAEYAGFRIFVCCDQCLERIAGQAAKVVKEATESKALIGDFLFDPNTKRRIEPKTAKFKATAGPFIVYSMTELTKDTLNQLAVLPKNESYLDPFTNVKSPWAAKAAAYTDLGETRLFFSSAQSLDDLTRARLAPPKGDPVVAHPYPIMGIDD